MNIQGHEVKPFPFAFLVLEEMARHLGHAELVRRLRAIFRVKCLGESRSQAVQVGPRLVRLEEELSQQKAAIGCHGQRARNEGVSKPETVNHDWLMWAESEE